MSGAGQSADCSVTEGQGLSDPILLRTLDLLTTWALSALPSPSLVAQVSPPPLLSSHQDVVTVQFPIAPVLWHLLSPRTHRTTAHTPSLPWPFVQFTQATHRRPQLSLPSSKQ